MSEFAAWINSGDTGAEGLGKIFGRLLSGGVDTVNSATSLKVTERGAGANNSVDIAAGMGVVLLSDYGIPVWTTATINKTVTAADPSNPRRSIVVAYVDLAAYAINNNIGATKFVIVDGTPAGTPTDPSDVSIQAAVGPGNPWMKLARIQLPAAAPNVINSYITDLRTPVSLKGRLWGGSTNTNGHTVPDVADDIMALIAAAQVFTNKTIDTQANTILNQGYQIIKTSTLAVAGDTFTITSIPARKHLQVLMSLKASAGGTINTSLRFNNDSSSSYNQRVFSDYSATGSSVGNQQIDLDTVTPPASSMVFITMSVLNIETEEKFVNIESQYSPPGSANVVSTLSVKAKWSNVAAQINRMDILNIGTGDIAAGSRVIIMGHD